MDARELAIRYFTKLKGKKKNINNTEFQKSVNKLKQEIGTGFDEEEVETLIDALVYIEGLSSTRFQDLLKCIIPNQKVAAKSALKLLQWIFTYNFSAPLGSIVTALEWIIGLVEFGLTDENSVHAFYHHFFILLHDGGYKAKCAGKLIHLLTRPSDVLRWVVTRVLEVETTYGKQKHITALLGLFKSYKPECVPEKVPAIDLQSVFKNVGKMNPHFQRAQQRLQTENAENHKRKIVWNTDGGMKRVKTGRTGLIPPVDYVHFQSQMYREESLLRSILEFKTMASLESHLHELDMPCNVMTLLQNDAGLVIIAFGDKQLQTQFSFNLYYTLHRVFIQHEVGHSYEDKEKLLTRIVALEEYLQQGIPVVSRFLSEYILMWDSEDFRESILKLLQWVTFSSYQELHDLILDHIFTMFVSGSIKVKISVIATLNRFVQNLIIFGLNERKHMFLKNEGDWNEIETVQCIIEFVSKVCELGLIMERGNYLVLNEVFNFFEMITFLEEQYKLPIWTMAPPVVVYSGLITRNAFMLSRACGILLKYEHVYPRLKKMKLRDKFTAQVDHQKMFLSDFTNCLYEGMCFENPGSYLFKDIPPEQLLSLSECVEPNDALIFKNNFAMLPYIALNQNCTALDSAAFDEDTMLIIIKMYFKQIHNLINQLVDLD